MTCLTQLPTAICCTFVYAFRSVIQMEKTIALL